MAGGKQGLPSAWRCRHDVRPTLLTLAYCAKTRKGWVAGQTGRLAQNRPGAYGCGVQ